LSNKTIEGHPRIVGILYKEKEKQWANKFIQIAIFLCENNQQGAPYRLTYYFKSALHVSGDVSAHHQELLTVFTVSVSVHPSCCRLPAGSNLDEHYQIL